MWIKVNGKLYKRILGYSEKDKLTDKKANNKLEKVRNDIEAGFTSTNAITLNRLFELYYETLNSSEWTKKKLYIYNHYIKEHLGTKNIEKIREMDVQKVLAIMSDKGLSPRSRKSILEVLKPLYQFANKNRYTRLNPVQDITVKIPNQKKVVTNATELFYKIYKGILSYYKDNPFYQALFLFSFTGRRKKEILNLRWENIDFINDYYWIEDTKNSDKQRFPLPEYVKEPLLK